MKNKSEEINKMEIQKEQLYPKQIKMNNSIEECTLLFDYAPTSYFILDKNGIILNVNKTGANHIGTTKSKLIGTHFSKLLNSEIYQDEFNKYRNLVIETGINRQFEAQIKRFDGAIFFALMESVIIKDAKKNFKHFFLTISNITEQKEQEHKIALALIKERELNNMKTQFVTIASHEFRTPLATILTSSELIGKYSKSEDEGKREVHIQKIRSSVHRLIEILMDFMSVNEIEKGTIQNNPETFNLVQFIESIINEIKSFNGTHSVNYVHCGTGEYAIADKKLLKTCISNLLINAYKYSPNGGTIEIDTEIISPQNFILDVKDYGIGIPEKDQSKIFNQFFRAKNSENIQGTGLGLNITKTLITIMGGKISFKSKENSGSTFSLHVKV